MKTLKYGEKYGMILIDCVGTEHVDIRGKSSLYVGWDFQKQRHVVLVKHGFKNNRCAALIFEDYKLEQRQRINSNSELIPTIIIDDDFPDNEIVLEGNEAKYAKSVLKRGQL